MERWPGEEDATEAETQVRPPSTPVESERRAALRSAAGELKKAGPGIAQPHAGTDLIVLGLLEVAGAIDRLTKTIREREER